MAAGKFKITCVALACGLCHVPTGPCCPTPTRLVSAREARPRSCCEHWLRVCRLRTGQMSTHQRGERPPEGGAPTGEGEHPPEGGPPGLLLHLPPPPHRPQHRVISECAQPGLPRPCSFCNSHTAGAAHLYLSRNRLPCPAALLTWHTVTHPFKPTSVITYWVPPVLAPT